MRLKDQVAIITGAGRNIGEAICKLFVQEGARVAVVDLDPSRGSRVAGEINAVQAGKAIPVACDVSSSASVEKMVLQVVKEFG
jgi:NAD(P)-dependent dehydrogenase (short-subunit alcohol dehydrogenase family)